MQQPPADTTNSAPVFSDGASTTRTIAENTAAGVNIGAAITATDADNDTLTYSLSGTDAASFSILSTTGQLQTRAALDFESKNSYTVTVTVSDNNGDSDSITVIINITDENESPTTTPESPTLSASTTSPLTEATLHGGVVTLTLISGTYERSSFQIKRALTVSGIDGITVGTFGVNRVSDTQVTIELTFSGNMTSDGTLTFTVGSVAVANYSGSTLSAQIAVSASTESVVASAASTLTEETLDGSVVTLTLSGRKFAGSVWDIRDAASVSGITGVTIDRHFHVQRVSDTQVTIELTFSGNIASDGTLTFTVGADAIAGYDGVALTAQLAVSVTTESVAASTDALLTEATLDESVVTLTLSGRKFARSVWDIRDAASVSGIAGVTIDRHFHVQRVSDTQVTIELTFSGNMTSDGTLTFTVGADAIAKYNGPSLTAQLTVTASRENALLTNFPNPFNPETWIPYHLSNDADVQISIYDTKGVLVRRLDLGHQIAGYYTNRTKAAYWDGKNEFGEQAASGVYFYRLSAGDYFAVRKMLILK